MKNLVKNIVLMALWFTFPSCNQEQRDDRQEMVPELVYDQNIILTQDQVDLAGINTAKPAQRIISGYVLSNGHIEVPPQNQVSIHASTTGFVRKVNFLPGDNVKKGQLLCILEHPDFARLQQDFLETISQRQYLKNELERKQELFKSEATSQKALQLAEADYKIQDARYKGLKAELNLIGFSAKNIEETETIQTNLYIFSPVDGIISQVNINQGKLIHPNDLIYQIIDKSELHIELKVFARDIEKLQEGQIIYFKLPEGKDTLEAIVHIVNRMIDPLSNISLVHGHLVDENDKERLNPGTYVNAKIRLSDAQALSVPNDAIFFIDGKPYVFIKNNKNYHPMAITTGISNEEFTEVLNFDPGQEVVVKGINYLLGMKGEGI